MDEESYEIAIDEISDIINRLLFNKKIINYKGELFYGTIEIPLKSGAADDLVIREIRKSKTTQ